MSIPAEQPRLRLEIKNTQPVELFDLTQSLASVGDEFRRYVLGQPDIVAPKEIKLYVTEIRTGSVITELAPYLAAAVLPFVENANSVIAFAGHLKQTYRSLLGQEPPPEGLEKRNYENVSGILDPVAKDNGSQLVISTVVNNNLNLTINVDSNDANAIQNRARREIERLKEPVERVRENVALYWDQARNDIEAKAGDRGVIESISSSAVKVRFDPPTLKEAMLYTDDPFRKVYVVDVRIETVAEQPVLYVVTAVHEAFDREV